MAFCLKMELRTVVVFLMILVVLPDAVTPLGPGSICTTSEGNSGVCDYFENCAKEKKTLMQEGEYPVACSQSRQGTVYCCENGGTVSSTVTPTDSPNTPPSKGGIVSQRKCKQYSKWVSDYSPVIGEYVHHAGQCHLHSTPFILNGTKVTPKEFPHMVHLGYTRGGLGDEEIDWKCGASLISDQWVLTAAHCLQTKKNDKQVLSHAKLGFGDDQSYEEVKIIEKISHPKYEQDKKDYDIALLKLERKIKYTDYRRPACLYRKQELPAEMVATGWGKTENGTLSQDLLKVTLPEVPFVECNKYYKYSVSLNPKYMFCAGGLNTGADTCQGDSGGPLQILVENPSCMYLVAGITSFGSGCGKYPGVYTRVTDFLVWIEDIVWPEEPRPIRRKGKARQSWNLGLNQ